MFCGAAINLVLISIHIITKNQSNGLLLIDSNSKGYNKSNVNEDGSILWRCTNWHKGCKSSLTTDSEKKVIKRQPKDHTGHDSLSKMDIEMLVAHAETKERAKNEPKSSVGEIFREEVAKMFAKNASGQNPLKVDTHFGGKYNFILIK